MKLVVSHLETLRTYVTREFYYVTRELLEKYGWQHIEIFDWWNARGTLRDKLLYRFGEMPETILFWEAYEFLHAHAQEVYRLDCDKVFFTDDLHWWNERLREQKLISFALCDTVLATCRYTWDKFYPQFCGTKKVIWIPHSASPDFLLPFNQRPANSILLSGALTAHYPLRQQMKSLHDRGDCPIAYHGHPGYYCGYDYQGNRDIGRGYAEIINAHRTGFTDSLIYRYVVAKYFEIPATGALLLGDDAVREPLRRLGFTEDQHYVSASHENLEQRIKYVLDERNHDHLDEVRKRGQALVWERHTTRDRAREINQACSN